MAYIYSTNGQWVDTSVCFEETLTSLNSVGYGLLSYFNIITVSDILNIFNLRSSRLLKLRFLFSSLLPCNSHYLFPLASFSESFHFSSQISVSVSGLSLCNSFQFFCSGSKGQEI